MIIRSGRIEEIASEIREELELKNKYDVLSVVAEEQSDECRQGNGGIKCDIRS